MIFCVDASNQTECQGVGRAYRANKCVSLHSYSGMSWYNARQSCVDAGGDLLRLDNDVILEYLTSWLRDDEQPGSQSRWWIDGVNEIWNWDDGKWCLPISLNPIVPNPRVRVGLGLGLGSGLHHALCHDALSTSVSNNFVHVRRIWIRRNGAEPGK